MNAEQKPASISRRFLAGIIDTFIILIIQAILIYILAQIDRLYPIAPTSIDLTVGLITLVFSFFVFIRPLSEDGTTPGNRYLKIKCIRYDSSDELGINKVLAREILAKTLSAILFPVVLVFWVCNKEKRCLHDILTKTAVIKS